MMTAMSCTCLEERPQAPVIFDARRALDAGRHVDAERPHARDRLGDVVRRQPAGQHDPALAPRSRPPPSSRSSCPVPPRRTGSWTSSSSVTRAGPRARRVRRRRRDSALIDRPRRAPRANAGVSSPWSCTAPSRTRLGDAVDVVEPAGSTNTPTVRHERRQRRRDRPRAVRIDEARAARARRRSRSRRRPASTAASRVLEPRDAADLDEHHLTRDTGTPSPASAVSASAAPGIRPRVMNRSPMRNAP